MGTYGWGIAGNITYATRWGIILNTERVEQRRSSGVLTAFAAALGNVTMDKSWFDAVAATAEEAEAEFNRFKAKERLNESSRMF